MSPFVSLENGDLISNVETIVANNLAQSGATIVARVPDAERSTDFALQISPQRLAVVRSVHRSTAEDHTALATMIAEGDFIWGAVVYEQAEAPHSPCLVESFHVSQLDQLVARLDELREALSEHA